MEPVTNMDARRLEEAAQWSLRLADDPAAEQTKAFQQWVSHAANRETLRDLDATLSGIEHLAGAPGMVTLRGQALAAARRSHGLLRARAFMRSGVGRAAAAMLAVLVPGLSGYWLLANPRNVSTDIGERQVMSLADGSRLSLDAATELRMAYSDERRRLVLERGRARFDVAKDPLRPFTVQAGDRLIVAIGTSFSVELLGDQVRVALYEGKVEVLPASGDPRSSAQRVALEPGHELIFESRRPTHALALDVRRSLAWETGGDLTFVDEPLALAVERVNRYSSQRIRIADDAAAQVRISGVFHAGDAEAFVDGVTRLFPVRAVRGGSDLILRHAAAAQ